MPLSGQFPPSQEATIVLISITLANYPLGLGFCHSIMFVKLNLIVVWKWRSLSRVLLFATPWTIQSWNSPGRNTGAGSLSLLQGIFPTQGSNPGLPHSRQMIYQLSHKGSPRILEWVAYPLSRGSSWPRNQTRVFCIAGGLPSGP